MSKTRSRKARATADRSATTDVVTQLECAFRRPQATLIGALVGGIVPWFARTLAHDQLPAAWSAGNAALAAVMLAVVLGCALFSAITVYKFGRATFNDKRKALGFVAAIEGVMLVSTGATSNVALLVLILINALANGSAIALAREATCKRREAAARASATRARARKPAVETPVVQPPAQEAPAPRARRHTRCEHVRARDRSGASLEPGRCDRCRDRVRGEVLVVSGNGSKSITKVCGRDNDRSVRGRE